MAARNISNSFTLSKCGLEFMLQALPSSIPVIMNFTICYNVP